MLDVLVFLAFVGWLLLVAWHGGNDLVHSIEASTAGWTSQADNPPEISGIVPSPESSECLPLTEFVDNTAPQIDPEDTSLVIDYGFGNRGLRVAPNEQWDWVSIVRGPLAGHTHGRARVSVRQGTVLISEVGEASLSDAVFYRRVESKIIGLDPALSRHRRWSLEDLAAEIDEQVRIIWSDAADEHAA